MQDEKDGKLAAHKPLPLLQFLWEQGESVEFRGQNN